MRKIHHVAGGKGARRKRNEQSYSPQDVQSHHNPKSKRIYRAGAADFQEHLCVALRFCVRRRCNSIAAWGNVPGIEKITISAESADQSRGSVAVADYHPEVFEARLQRLLNTYSNPGALPQAP
jgi:hypothetical protein